MLSPDVTHLLTDPDIGGGVAFTVLRNVRTRSLLDGPTNSIERIAYAGNIQPAQPDDLQQLPEEQRSETVIVIRSTFHFQLGSDAEGTETMPDEVEFKGRRYKVTRVDDWNAWGFTSAWATLREDVTVDDQSD